MTKEKDAWRGKDYHKYSSTQHQGGLAALANYHFNDDEWVLDVGCGTGRIAAAIAAKVSRGQVIGIDASPSMVHEAQQTYGSIENLNFILHDATTFNFDKKFDLIVSFFALHWMKDQAAVFKNMYKHLKPGGKIILRMSGGNQPEIDDVFDREPWKSLIKIETWHGKNTEEYVALLKEAGFKNIDARTEWHARAFTSKQALFEHLMTWMPHATGLPTELVQQMAGEIAENIIKNQKVSGTQVESRSPMALIEATI